MTATAIFVPATTVKELGVVLLALGVRPDLSAGGASVTHVLRLPRNAILDQPLLATLSVADGTWFRASDVAALRPADATGGTGTRTVVVDFGSPRTVSAMGVTTGTIAEAYRWLGASFDDHDLMADSSFMGFGFERLGSEVRTERLKLVISNAAAGPLGPQVALELPEPPGDLELRLDGGPPLWSSVGPVLAGSLAGQPQVLAAGKVAQGAGRWRTGAVGHIEQQVDLREVINAGIGDPDADRSSIREFAIQLTSRVPGAIGLTVADPAAHLLYQVRLGEGFVDGAREVPFTGEGEVQVALTLPPWGGSVRRVAVSCTATPGKERVLPPLGPPSTPVAPVTAPSAAVPAAEFVIDSDRALTLPLPSARDLAELTAVRVPLLASMEGAELRAVLLGRASATDPSPGAPLEGLASDPVTLEAARDGAEQWVTLRFRTPVALETSGAAFVALHVIRGRASMAAATAAVAMDGVADVWRGPPAGPWEQLPPSAGLRDFRGRLRVAGTAPGNAPVAPLRLALGASPGRADGVTPTAKGVAVTRSAAGPSRALHVVALTACTLTLRDLVATITATD